MKWKFWVNGMEIASDDINRLKEFAVELRAMASDAGTDLSKSVHDFCFAVDVAYQNYH